MYRLSWWDISVCALILVNEKTDSRMVALNDVVEYQELLYQQSLKDGVSIDIELTTADYQRFLDRSKKMIAVIDHGEAVAMLPPVTAEDLRQTFLTSIPENVQSLLTSKEVQEKLIAKLTDHPKLEAKLRKVEDRFIGVQERKVAQLEMKLASERDILIDCYGNIPRTVNTESSSASIDVAGPITRAFRVPREYLIELAGQTCDPKAVQKTKKIADEFAKKNIKNIK